MTQVSAGSKIAVISAGEATLVNEPIIIVNQHGDPNGVREYARVARAAIAAILFFPKQRNKKCNVYGY